MWWSALLNYLDFYPDNHFPTLLSHNCSLPWWSKLGRGTPSTWHLRSMPSEGFRVDLKWVQEWLPRPVLSLGPDGRVPTVSNLFCELRLANLFPIPARERERYRSSWSPPSFPAQKGYRTRRGWPGEHMAVDQSLRVSERCVARRCSENRWMRRPKVPWPRQCCVGDLESLLCAAPRSFSQIAWTQRCS